MRFDARKITRTGVVAFVVAIFTIATTLHPSSSRAASADDTARFLAGMPVSANSPLLPLIEDPASKQHAARFDTAFGNLEKNQLAKIRAWSAANMATSKPVLFYMFGGPDFLYADAFFPNATTYVLSGLEPVGQIPDLMKLPRWSVMQSLGVIQSSLRSVLSVSYFITVDMFRDLRAGPINGTLPILYVFLARSNKVIHDVSLVYLDEQGALQPDDGTKPWLPARGAKIIFSEKDGPKKTLYYFSTNLSDSPGKNNSLLQYCKSLGRGESFVKSASYLLHQPGFAQVRNFILSNSDAILQDDTGVPITYFDPTKWQLLAFGRYVTPIFPAFYQPKLSEFFQKVQPSPLDFGVGYRWRPNESNLMVAARIPDSGDITSSIVEEPRPQTQQQQIYRAPTRTNADNDPFSGPPPFPFSPFGPPDKNPGGRDQYPVGRDHGPL